MSSICSMPTESRIISGRTPAFVLFLRRHLPMRGRGRVAGERLGIAHIDQPLEQLERVVERLARLEPADDAEGQERASAAVEIFPRQSVIGIIGKAGVIDPFDPRIAAQEFGDAARILDVALDAQRHRFDALQQQEGRQRRQHGAGGALIDAAAAGDIGGLAEMLRVDQAVIGRIGLVEHREAARVLLPGKRPELTMAPPSVVPWPPRNFVSE